MVQFNIVLSFLFGPGLQMIGSIQVPVLVVVGSKLAFWVQFRSSGSEIRRPVAIRGWCWSVRRDVFFTILGNVAPISLAVRSARQKTLLSDLTKMKLLHYLSQATKFVPRRSSSNGNRRRRFSTCPAAPAPRRCSCTCWSGLPCSLVPPCPTAAPGAVRACLKCGQKLPCQYFGQDQNLD